MPHVDDFDALWKRYQEGRTIGATVNPGHNRCALVLGYALQMKYKPRPEKGEFTFRETSEPPAGMRGQPFLDHFYLRAEQLAHRLEEEWGPPDIRTFGNDGLKPVEGKKGVIFVEDAWGTGRFRELARKIEGRPLARVSHIDLWNGTEAGSESRSEMVAAIGRAKSTWLWLIVSSEQKS